jgi:sulfotransferase
MQCVLNNDPRIYAGGTDGCLELLFGARANFQSSPEFKALDYKLMEKAFKSFCKGGLESYAEAIIDGTEKEYVCLKSRGFGVYRGFINEFYPDPKIICLVRDLRDIFCSYEKIYRKNQLAGDPIRSDQSGRGTTVHKRIDEWAMPTSTIGRGVERLFEIIRLGYDDKILFVKYEDLCLYPETEMTRIYEYLEIPYYSHDFDNIPQTIKEEDSIYGLGEGLHTIRPKLEYTPSTAKKILGADVSDWIFNNYQWFYNRFGYKK